MQGFKPSTCYSISFSLNLEFHCPPPPPKIGFFAWEASWGKVFTLDQLKRRGRALVNCCLCEEDEETIKHLLIHCKKARMLWDLFLSIVGTEARTWTRPWGYDKAGHGDTKNSKKLGHRYDKDTK